MQTSDLQIIIQNLKTALRVAIEMLEIGRDWDAPRYYDLPVPEGWESTVDPDSEEPGWIALYLAIAKMKGILEHA